MMSIDYRAAEQGLIGKPMKPIAVAVADKSFDANALTVTDNCDTIDGVREVPIGSLAPGRRFELVLTATSNPPYKRLRGTLIRKGPGTVAVVLDQAERERSFTTQEGSVVTLRTVGGIVYWSPSSPVIDLRESKDVSRWTTRGGTGVGEDMHHPANFQHQTLDSARLGEKDEGEVNMGERIATLPGTAGTTGKSKASKSKGKAKVAKGRVKTPKELHPCLCGCGDRVAGRFRQGHDGRYYSLLKKVSAGDMQFNELPKTMQAALESVAGVKKALKDSKH